MHCANLSSDRDRRQDAQQLSKRGGSAFQFCEEQWLPAQAWDRYAVKKGIRIGGNKFRNSYIFFRLAETRDIQLVALESGNSPAVIQREYLELAPPEDAKKWFAIKPSVEKQNELRRYTHDLLEVQHAYDDGEGLSKESDA